MRANADRNRDASAAPAGPERSGGGGTRVAEFWLAGGLVRTGEVFQCAAFIISLNRRNHLPRSDQRHALSDPQAVTDGYRLEAQVSVIRAALANGLAQAPPAAPGRAAFQRSDRVKELVVGIHLPVRRLPAAGDYDAWPSRGPAGMSRDRRRKVHGERDRAQHAVGVVHHADKLADIGRADQVDHIPERGVPVTSLTALDKTDPPEVVGLTYR